MCDDAWLTANLSTIRTHAPSSIKTYRLSSYKEAFRAITRRLLLLASTRLASNISNPRNKSSI